MLDFLRGVAILMVFVFHYYGHTYGVFRLPWSGDWPDWNSFPWASYHWLYVLRLGGDGVSLFFVLSGFCIHHACLQRRARGQWQGVDGFYWTRFFRIVPPYLAAMLLFGGLFGFGGWRGFLTHLTLTHSLFPDPAIYFGINASFWSLSVEWLLYLVYPLLLWSGRRISAPWLLLATLACAWCFKRALPATEPLDIRRLPGFYLYEWWIGGYVADVWFHTRKPAFRHVGMLLTMLVPLWMLTNVFRPLNGVAWWIKPTLFAVVLDRALTVGAPTSRGWFRACAHLGLISYSMYLLHQPLMQFTTEPMLRLVGLPQTTTTMITIALPVTLLALWGGAHLWYRLLELPSIALGKRGWPAVAAVLPWRTRGAPTPGGDNELALRRKPPA